MNDHADMEKAAPIGVLRVVPDYEDFAFAERDVEIRVYPGADPDHLAAELDRMAGTLDSEGRFLALHASLQRNGLRVAVGVAVSAELGVLLLRFAGNHIRRLGLPGQDEWIVLADPYDSYPYGM